MKANLSIEEMNARTMALSNDYAGEAVAFADEASKEISKADCASIMVAAAIHYCVKTMVVAGFSKEETVMAITTIYDSVKSSDVHALIADAMRTAKKETKQ